DCGLAHLEQSQLGARTKPIVETRLDVLKDLERLPEVVAGHSEQRSLEFTSVVFVWRHDHAWCLAGICRGLKFAVRAVHSVGLLRSIPSPTTTCVITASEPGARSRRPSSPEGSHSQHGTLIARIPKSKQLTRANGASSFASFSNDDPRHRC